MFSLELVNWDKDRSEFDPARGRSIGAMRTALAIKDQHGNDAVGRFYKAVGDRIFQGTEPPDDPATSKAALADIGIDADIYDAAVADDTTWKALQSAHDAVVAAFGTFGVPTICLNGGDGPSIFGPVISNPPDDEGEARELWHHVSWLAHYENFAELKRDRLEPDLELVRKHKAERGE